MEALNFCADTSNWEVFSNATSRKVSILSGTNKQGSISRNVSSNSAGQGSVMGDSSSISVSSSISLQYQQQMSFTSFDMADVNTQMESFQEVYDSNVTRKLEQGREHLAKLYPLTFRVETLENIFALLFATNEDIQEEVAAGISDSGEESAVGSRGTSQGGSRENLSSLGSVNDFDNPDLPHKNLEVTDENTFLWTNQKEGTKDQIEVKTSEDSHKPGELPMPKSNSPKLKTASPKASSSPKQKISETRDTVYGGFSISKIELKEQPYSSTGLEGKKISGNHSGNSNTSTGSAYKIGFVSNEYFVRDLLSILKECLLDLSATKFSLLGKTTDTSRLPKGDAISKETEDFLTLHVQSSVSISELQHRISLLTQRVSEASWRYQLVSHDWIPQEVGKVAVDIQKLKDSPSEDELGQYHW